MPITPDYHFYRYVQNATYTDITIPTGTIKFQPTVSNVTFNKDILYSCWLLITRASQLSKVRMQTPASGKRILFGMYNTAKSPYNDLQPTTLFHDFGIITLSAINLDVTLSPTIDLPAGTYWAGIIPEEDSTTFSGTTSNNAETFWPLGVDTSDGTGYIGWSGSPAKFVDGLPATFPSPVRTKSAPQFWVGISC